MTGQDQMPDRLGPYCLLDRIGEGGMGVVFLARDADQRTVALKVLRATVAAEPTARRRLAREVETMRRVRSPNVAEVIDADLTGDMPYIVTRYVPGQTLDQVITENGPLRGPDLARLACGLADALAAVHAAGVVHRDLKPGNVMLLKGSPVVIDFGIAHGPEATRLTETGMFMGTPGYLAPEVIEGQPSSAASDVHAWGATVAFAATGRPPYGTGSFESIFYRILNGQPDLAGTPTVMLPLLAAALAREPAHRPPAIQLSAQAGVLEPGALVPGPVPGPGQGMAPAAPAMQVTRADVAPGPPVVPGALPWQPQAPGQIPPAPVPAGMPPGVPSGLVAPGPPGVPPGLVVPGAAGVPAGYVPPGTAGAAPGMAPGAVGMPPAGLAGGAAMAPGLAPEWTRPLAGGQAPPDDFADVLPPVDYQRAPRDRALRSRAGRPPATGQPPSDGPLAALRDSKSAQAGPRSQYLLVLATMVVAASVSVILPVAGTATAVAVIMALRASELAQQGAARRRGGQGGVLLAVLTFPWYLLRAFLGLLWLSPFALVTAVVVGGIALAVAPGHQLSRAIAFAAGGLVAYYGLGPGSGRSRRQLSRVFSSVFKTRMAQAVATIGMTALAIAAMATALAALPVFSPLSHAADPFGVLRLGRLRHLGVTGRQLLSYLRRHG